MEELTLLNYTGIFILIAFSGFVDSIAGGGGLISIPTYIIFGIPAENLLGTNKTVSTTGTTLAVFRYIKEKRIDWNTTGYAVIFSLLGSYFGARYSYILSKELMTYILIGIVPFILFLNFRLNEKPDSTQVRYLLVKSSLIGLIIGSYDGFFGPGTGSFLIFAFVTLLHWDFGKASANARVINYASNLSAFIFFLTSGKILWAVALVAICASIIGNWFGSGLVISKSSKIVKPMFNSVLCLLLLKCIYDLIY